MAGDAVGFTTGEPYDPEWSRQWGMQRIQANLAWEVTPGSPQVLVGVLDTGVMTDHPDLVDNMWTNLNEIPGNGIDDDGNGYIDDIYGWNVHGNNPDVSDTKPVSKNNEGHGTQVAGIIAARGNNGIGVIGVESPATRCVVFSCGAFTNSRVLSTLNYLDHGCMPGAIGWPPATIVGDGLQSRIRTVISPANGPWPSTVI